MISIKNSLNRQAIENIKNDGIPVIIFGAGIVGEVLFKACRNVGIKVECFCDNNVNKTKESLCDIEVIHTSLLKKKFKDAVFLLSAADIKDVVDQLQTLGFSKWHPCSLLLKNFDAHQYQFSAPPDFVQYAVDTCLLCHDSYLTPDKLFLRSVDIIITERCSLKCRDCSNLMPYYQKPVNCDTSELMQSIDAFCNIIDEVNEFRVIGGEPFMNQEFDLIIKRLVVESKVKKIVIYTNGTIIPPEDKMECLKNDKVLLIITDYGKLSGNIDTLTQKLSTSNIAFYRQKPYGWTDCAKIARHYRSIEQQREIFKKCCAKNTMIISDWKLYRCPFAANTARLGAVPDNENDYINFLKASQEVIDISEMKKKIKKYILEKDFLEICDYCSGRSFGDPEIQPAIQISKPIEYKKY